MFLRSAAVTSRALHALKLADVVTSRTSARFTAGTMPRSTIIVGMIRPYSQVHNRNDHGVTSDDGSELASMVQSPRPKLRVQNILATKPVAVFSVSQNISGMGLIAVMTPIVHDGYELVFYCDAEVLRGPGRSPWLTRSTLANHHEPNSINRKLLLLLSPYFQ
jgi:hypothetical protein